MKQTTCLFVLAIALVVGAAYASVSVRGVKPSAQHLYKGDFIECDKGKKVPIGRVNDDFCDCHDGTDEPGTSACTNGKFFCVNEGFRGVSIPSSWLGDGHCDCCDGSDETSGKCPNTCKEQAKAHESSVANEIGLQERGLRQRDAYVAHARAERDRHVKLISETEVKYAVLDTKVQELEKVKVAAEDAYNAAYEAAETKINAEYDAKEAEKTEENKVLPEGADVLAAHRDDEKPRVDDDATVAPLKEDASQGVRSGRVSEVVDEDEDPSLWSILWQGYADMFKSIGLLITELPGFKSTPQTEKEKAVREWTDAKNERDGMARELEGYRKFVNIDFGADSAFHALYGTTYEFLDKEYTYKLNAFNDVQQTKPGHSSTLGRWKGWDENQQNVMIYDSGDRCWGAPDRSTRVTLVCGDENKIVEVQEPNKCEYSMKIRTPAACSKADLEALRNGE